MMTSAIYGNTISPNPTPEWFKAERYDYCDSLFKAAKKTKSSGLIAKLSKQTKK